MADFPLFGGSGVDVAGFDITSISGTDVASSSTTNTKGAWTELLSSVNNTSETNGVSVYFLGESTVNTHYLVDIAVGGAGQEQVIIENIYTRQSISNCSRMDLPLNIPKGARISARCQSYLSSSIVNVHLDLKKGGFKKSMGLSEVFSIGENLSSTRGTNVPYSTAFTFGSFIEITPSTQKEISTLNVACMRFTNFWGVGRMTYQIAIGAAGFEQVICENCVVTTASSETGNNLISPNYEVSIPEGTRLSIRATGTAVNLDFNLDYVIYGGF